MNTNDFEHRIDRFQELIDNAKSIVFFGGAGVSTESGIPDFRSKDGLYNQKDIRFEKYKPEYLLSKQCLDDKPDVFFEFYRQKMDCRNIEPNMAHKKLAELEAAGKLDAIVTQNIDGLHQKAGSKNVYEIHGTTQKVYCMECGEEENPNIMFESDSAIPRCKCGGMIRPDVTLYGENLPFDAVNNARHAIRYADLLIVGGTSLTVYPANTLVNNYFGKIVLINRDSTPMDGRASILFHESIGEVFAKIHA